MKQLIGYFPLFTVIMLAFGYAQMHYYYHSFGIQIEHYISLNEIVLNFFPTILDSALIIGALVVLLFTILVQSYRFNLIKTGKFTVFYAKYHLVMSGIFLLFGTIALIANLIIKHNYGSYKYILFNCIIDIIDGYFILFTCVCLLPINKIKEYLNKYKLLVPIVVLTPLFVVIKDYENFTAKSIKSNGNNIHVSFHYHDTVLPNKNDCYIGETNEFVFLWDRQNKKSLIFPKNEIINYTIQDNN